jgi:hypothetical protein
LNSNVYRARVDFVIFAPFADSQLRDTFCAGKITLLILRLRSPCPSCSAKAVKCSICQNVLPNANRT